MQDTSTSSKIRIPFEAMQISMQAAVEKGEFSSSTTTSFPLMSFTQPFFGGDPHGPTNWTTYIRVISNDAGSITQLYVSVANRPQHGLVGYDKAVLPGGAQLPLNYITSTPVRSDSPGHWVEDVAVTLSTSVLTDHLHKPLRVQISRPQEGVSFVVEIPAHYVAAVLYKFNPEEYEVDQASTLPPQQGAFSQEQAATVRQLKNSAWVGAAVGVVAFALSGLMDGFAFGVGAWIAAFHGFKKLEESRRQKGNRHYLRSPVDKQ